MFYKCDEIAGLAYVSKKITLSALLIDRDFDAVKRKKILLKKRK